MSLVTKLIDRGTRMKQEQRAAEEANKLGYLRGGSTGMMTKDGKFYGESPAFAYLRMQGINYDEISISKQLMFDGGEVNEDIWLDALRRSWPGFVCTDVDIPTKWHTSNGTLVTGRPDVGLKARESDDFLQEGIELKQCMSFNSAYGKSIRKIPDTKHVLQAMHYQWQHGNCPWSIWYTNRSNFDAPSWVGFIKDWPLPGEPGSEHLQYRYYKWGEINPKTNKPKKSVVTEEYFLSNPDDPDTFAEISKIVPFLQGFDVEIHEGSTCYLRDASTPKSELIETILNVEGIERFFEFVSKMKDSDPLPPGAINIDPFGKKIGWKFADYSILKDLHPEKIKGKMTVGEWVDKVKEFAELNLTKK